jgi:hypothetical protein
LAHKNDISYIIRQRFTTEYCVKSGKVCEKMLDLLQCMYGTEAKAKLNCFKGGTVLQMEIKGWLSRLEVGDQAVLLQM